MSNKNIKSITASNFKTFVSILREEQKQRYMLVKFDYKNGYFCGVLSNDNYFIPSSYHEALAAINPDSKELVLRQIMSLVVAATGEKVPEYELDGGPLTQEQIEQIKELSPVSDLPESRITKRLFEEPSVVNSFVQELVEIGNDYDKLNTSNQTKPVQKQRVQRNQRSKE